jgi:hypothetical protein
MTSRIRSCVGIVGRRRSVSGTSGQPTPVQNLALDLLKAERDELIEERDKLRQALWDHEKILRSVRDAVDLHLSYIATLKKTR